MNKHDNIASQKPLYQFEHELKIVELKEVLQFIKEEKPQGFCILNSDAKIRSTFKLRNNNMSDLHDFFWCFRNGFVISFRFDRLAS